MPWRIAFDLVTSVRRFLGRRRAVSKAWRWMRSTPARVNTAVSVPTSIGRPRWARPPWPAYSPSEFSRMMTQSIASAPASGLRTPGSSRVGRTLAYWSKPCAIGRRRPQSEMSSGTSWLPTEPNRIASKPFSRARPPSGM